MQEKYIKIILFIFLIVPIKYPAQTWEILNSTFPASDTLLENATIIFVNKNIGWTLCTGSQGFSHITKLFETKNGGNNWEIKFNLGNYSGFRTSFNIDSNNIWFLDGVGRLYFSSDMGLTWDTSRITYKSINTVGYYFGLIYFFNNNNGIAFNSYRWFTNDGGYNWTKDSDTITVFPVPEDVCFIDNKLGWLVSLNPFVSDGGCIGNTIDGGKTWRYLDSITNITYGVYFIDSLKGFTVGTNVMRTAGCIKSTEDGGKSWIDTTYEGVGPFRKIGFVDSLNGWIVGNGKIYRSTNGGDDWELQVDSLKVNFEQLIILKKDKVAFAFGKDWNGKTHSLLRADLSNLTDIKERNKKKPEDYFLFENYPNPFNSSTVISYCIPEHSNVKIKLYNLLGEEIKILMNKDQVAGKYQINFNGDDLASGIYFYQLITEKFQQTKKMLLLR